MSEERLSFQECVDRYRQTLVFNNDLLKRDYPDRYTFNTGMRVNKMLRLDMSISQVSAYETRRSKEYDAKFKKYAARLDASVDGSVKRYVDNLRMVFLTSGE